MQKSKPANIADSIAVLQKLTAEAEVLLDNTRYDGKVISALKGIYKKREFAIMDINKWVASDEGKIFIFENKKNWDNLIFPLFEKDRSNLKKIKLHLDELGTELKQLNKKKSLLIYTKK